MPSNGTEQAHNNNNGFQHTDCQIEQIVRYYVCTLVFSVLFTFPGTLLFCCFFFKTVTMS